MQNANVLNWLRENLQRLFVKSPLFFKIWTIIFGALVLITGVPDFINMLDINGITIPNLWDDAITKAVAWASRGGFIMSMLTTQSNPTAITDQGKVIKTTDTKKLPFTAAVEQKTAVKKMVDVVEINKAP
ncbi:MAG TPA: hypothetical protein VIQ23_04200 [Hanamia sp.]|jgi:hypothetical protein